MREVDDRIWLATLLDYHSGYFDEVAGPGEPGPDPPNAELNTLSPG
jgi:hypothetical protein